MSAEYIGRLGEELAKKYNTRDPFAICRELGIELMFCDDFGSLKGMYKVIKRNRFIFINNSLDPLLQRIVCAHELGHDQLHRQLIGSNSFFESELYDMSAKPEYEANIFAAELMLDTAEICRYIYDYGYTAEQIANIMDTDINLVAIKAAQLVKRGYKLNLTEFKSDFLR